MRPLLAATLILLAIIVFITLIKLLDFKILSGPLISPGGEIIG